MNEYKTDLKKKARTDTSNMFSSNRRRAFVPHKAASQQVMGVEKETKRSKLKENSVFDSESLFCQSSFNHPACFVETINRDTEYRRLIMRYYECKNCKKKVCNFCFKFKVDPNAKSKRKKGCNSCQVGSKKSTLKKILFSQIELSKTLVKCNCCLKLHDVVKWANHSCTRKILGAYYKKILQDFDPKHEQMAKYSLLTPEQLKILGLYEDA